MLTWKSIIKCILVFIYRIIYIFCKAWYFVCQWLNYVTDDLRFFVVVVLIFLLLFFVFLWGGVGIHFLTFYYMFDLLKAFYTLSILDICERHLS